jgi:hypothetical protein
VGPVEYRVLHGGHEVGEEERRELLRCTMPHCEQLDGRRTPTRTGVQTRLVLSRCQVLRPPPSPYSIERPPVRGM